MSLTHNSHHSNKSPRSIVKKLCYLLLTLFLVAIIALIGIVLFVDPNNYKDRIETLARNKANIELHINGDLSWTLYPWLGIAITDTQISAIDDGQNPIASVSELSLSLKLIPLIQGNIEIDRLHVDRLNLSLLTDRDGSQNIDSFFPKKPDSQVTANIQEAPSLPASQSTHTNTNPSTVKSDRKLDIRAITFTNTQFILDDQEKGLRITGNGIDFELEGVSSEVPHFKINNALFNQGDVTYLDFNTGQGYAYQGINFALKNLLIDQDSSSIQRDFLLSFDQFKLDNGKLIYSERDSGKSLIIEPQQISSQQFLFSTLAKNSDLPWYIESFKIKDLSVYYRAQKEDAYQKIENISFETGRLNPQSSSPLSFSANITDTPTIITNIKGDLLLTLDLPNDQFKLSQLNIDFLAQKLPGLQLSQPLSLLIKGDMLIDTHAETITWNSPTFAINQTNLLSKFSLQGFSLPNMQINAQTNIKNLNLKEFLHNLGIALPAFNHPKSLNNVSLSSPISYQNGGLTLSPFSLIVDSSTFSGNMQFTDIAKLQGSITLEGDTINIDHYLTPSSSNNAKATASNKQRDQSTANQGLFPNLSVANLSLNAKIKSANMDTITASNIDISAVLNQQILTIKRFNATTLGGSIAINGALNGQTVTPAIKGQVTISQLPLSNLFMLLKKEIPLRGNLNLTSDFTTQGLIADTIINNLSGNIKANIHNGELIGINYQALACEGLSLINKETFQKNSTPQITPFTTLAATASIKNGIVNNNALTIEIPGLAANGHGTINLPRETLDYRIGLQVTESSNIPNCKIDRYLKNVSIPLRCQGRFVNASANLCGIDQEAIGKLIADVAKNKIESTLKDKLQEALPPILQKPKQEEKSQSPNPKDVLKAFEGLFKR